jgi:hypothetical protein
MKIRRSDVKNAMQVSVRPINGSGGSRSSGLRGNAMCEHGSAAYKTYAGDVLVVTGSWVAYQGASAQEAMDRYLRNGLELQVGPGVNNPHPCGCGVVTAIESANKNRHFRGNITGAFGAMIQAERSFSGGYRYAKFVSSIDDVLKPFGNVAVKQCLEAEADFYILYMYSGPGVLNSQRMVFAILQPYSRASSGLTSGSILGPEDNQLLCESDDPRVAATGEPRVSVPDGFWPRKPNGDPDKDYVVITLENVGFVRLTRKWETGTALSLYAPRCNVVYNTSTNQLVYVFPYACYAKLNAAITNTSTTVAVKYRYRNQYWHTTEDFERVMNVAIPEPICSLGSYQIPTNTLVTLMPGDPRDFANTGTPSLVLANIWGPPAYPQEPQP